MKVKVTYFLKEHSCWITDDFRLSIEHCFSFFNYTTISHHFQRSTIDREYDAPEYRF